MIDPGAVLISAEMQIVVRVLSIAIISLAAIQTLIALAQIVLAAAAFGRNPPMLSRGLMWATASDVSLPISIIVPAYNEEQTVVQNVRSMMALEYPEFEIVVVNDGSSDATLATLIEAYDLHRIERVYEAAVPHQPVRGIYGSARYPGLIVLDKENGGGKADALNAGINLSRHPIFCAIDADSILDADSLLRAVQPFVEDPTRVVAVGGTIRVINGCSVREGRITRVGLPKSLIELFQIMEYLRAFLIGRLAWNYVGALTIISGAFGIFSREVATAVGGYNTDSLGEDLEIIIAIHRHMREAGREYRVEFLAEPVCWTQVPNTLIPLASQRIRWQRGSLQTFFRHRKMLFNPRYGPVGTIGFGQMLVSDVLGPPAELLGYLLLPIFWWMGILDPRFILAFVALTVVFGIFFSVTSLIIEEIEIHRFPGARSLIVLFLVAVIENFGYRQLMSFYRIVGTWRHIRGAKATWNPIPRVAFSEG